MFFSATRPAVLCVSCSHSSPILSAAAASFNRRLCVDLFARVDLHALVFVRSPWRRDPLPACLATSFRRTSVSTPCRSPLGSFLSSCLKWSLFTQTHRLRSAFQQVFRTALLGPVSLRTVTRWGPLDRSSSFSASKKHRFHVLNCQFKAARRNETAGSRQRVGISVFRPRTTSRTSGSLKPCRDAPTCCFVQPVVFLAKRVNRMWLRTQAKQTRLPARATPTLSCTPLR